MPVKRSRNPLWVLFEFWVMAAGLGAFALLCVGSIPVFGVMVLVLPGDRLKPAVRGAISGAFRLYLRMLSGLCAVRADTRELHGLRVDGPLIVIANHPSLLDVVVLLSALPRGTCIIKASLLRNPLYRVAARAAGYISNASAEAMFARSRHELMQGSQFVIFPEGGRSREFPVSSFSSTCILLARATGTPIQTVLLDYSSPYLGKHWGLLSRPALPLLIRARMGRRIECSELRPSSRGELESYFRSQVRLDWV